MTHHQKPFLIRMISCVLGYDAFVFFDWLILIRANIGVLESGLRVLKLPSCPTAAIFEALIVMPDLSRDAKQIDQEAHAKDASGQSARA
jgi:hypothetical protein